MMSYQIAHTQVIEGIVVDYDTKETIPGAFVFLENTSIGNSTDLDGYFKVDVSEAPDLNVLISHIGYDSQKYVQSTLPDTIFLRPSQFELNSINIVGRNRKFLRNRRLTQFKAAFLGTEIKRNLVDLLNPEVLLFTKENGTLRAYATEPLKVKNQFLGYLITFYLEDFRLNSKNRMRFSGDIFYEELDGTKKELDFYKRNRRKTFQKSSRKFFQELINDELNRNDYVIGYSSLSEYGGISGFHEKRMKNFGVSKKGEEEYELPIWKEFTVVINEYSPNAQYDNATYFTSLSGKLILNKFGRIVNSKEIRQYGLWSEVRLDKLLPLDYAE